MLSIVRNPGLDLAALAAEYRQSRRIRIRDFFAPESAEAIHSELYNLPWHLAWNEGAEARVLDPDALSRLSPEEASRIQQAVHSGAQTGFQYLYNYFPLFTRYFADDGTGQPLFAFYEWLNSPATLAYLRELTGLGQVRWADGQATLYRAGHFLKAHTDVSQSEPRLAAYVFSFTRDWEADWGGLLHFWDRDFDGEFALRPLFNALSIFTVPADHSVSAVAAWSPGLRFSITGWLRADDPPKGLVRG